MTINQKWNGAFRSLIASLLGSLIAIFTGILIFQEKIVRNQTSIKYLEDDISECRIIVDEALTKESFKIWSEQFEDNAQLRIFNINSRLDRIEENQSRILRSVR